MHWPFFGRIKFHKNFIPSIHFTLSLLQCPSATLSYSQLLTWRVRANRYYRSGRHTVSTLRWSSYTAIRCMQSGSEIRLLDNVHWTSYGCRLKLPTDPLAVQIEHCYGCYGSRCNSQPNASRAQRRLRLSNDCFTLSVPFLLAEVELRRFAYFVQSANQTLLDIRNILSAVQFDTAECVHFEFCLQRKPLNFRFYGRSFAIAALVGKEYKRVQQKYNNLILFCSKFAVFRLPLDRRGHYLARIWRQSRWTVSRLDVGGKDWRSLVVSKISINLVDFLNGKVHVRGRLFEMDKPSLKFRSGFKPVPRTSASDWVKLTETYGNLSNWQIPWDIMNFMAVNLKF